METVDNKKEKTARNGCNIKKTMNVLKILFCALCVLPFVSLAVSEPLLRANPNINSGEIPFKNLIIIVSAFAVSVIGIFALGCIAAFVKNKLKVLSVMGMSCSAIASAMIIVFNFCLISTDVLFAFSGLVIATEAILFFCTAFYGFVCFVWQFDTQNLAIRIMQLIVTVGTFLVLPIVVMIEQNVTEITKLLPATVIIILLCVAGLIVVSEITKRKSGSDK